ncbi:MAG: CoA transferase [Betaproteobacteria bacterium]|nr:CoA transferase [Betaproteobacteria bacterium]
MLALQGIRVVDLSHVIAGPTASHYLAMLGAEVIKVETPAAGDVSRHGKDRLSATVSISFAAINAGKRSIAIDLKQPRLAAALRELVKSADVFIENFRPGTSARLGFDYDSVRALNPAIVYASISGYGQEGAWSSYGAYDHVVQAFTGMMMLQGEEGDAPLKVGFPVIDSASGMVASQAIIAALFRRERSGEGACLDISMVQAALQLMLPNAARAGVTGEDAPRIGNRGFSGSPGAQTFRCADGWISTAANTPPQFRAFCTLLGLDGIPEDASLIDQAVFRSGAGFVIAIDAQRLRELLEHAFAAASAPDLEARLNAAGVPAARVRTLAEFLEEAHSRQLVTLPRREAHYAQGTIRDFGIGFKAAGAEAGPLSLAPELGADTEALLGVLGLSVAEIDELARQGAIRICRPAQ